MLRRDVCRRLVVAAAGSLLLSGCSSGLALLPPGIPSGADLDSYSKTDFGPPYRIGATSRETLIIGIAYVDQRCSEFFDAVEQMSRQTEVFKSGFVTASTQAIALMALAKRSALSIARVAAAVEVTKVLLDEYKEQFTFSPHSSELRAIVMQAMLGQRKEFGLLVNGNQMLTDIEVIAAIKKYAENCTLAQIREHWNAAIAKAVREGVKPAPVSGAVSSRPLGGALVSDTGIAPTPTNVLGVNKYVVR